MQRESDEGCTVSQRFQSSYRLPFKSEGSEDATWMHRKKSGFTVHGAPAESANVALCADRREKKRKNTDRTKSAGGSSASGAQ